jgi:hypothetical protein
LKKLIAALVATMFLAGSAVAYTVVETDEVMGYDGDCTVYYRPDYGYFEVCRNEAPVFLGLDFSTVNFRREFREGPRFHTHFGQHWSGPRVQYKETTTTTERGHRRDH